MSTVDQRGFAHTREEHEPEDVRPAGVLAADLPRVEVVRVPQLAGLLVPVSLVPGVAQHGAVLLNGGLKRKSKSIKCMQNKKNSLYGPASKAMVLFGDGTIGHGLSMDIAKGSSIGERTCYACIAYLDTKVSDQEEGKSSLMLDRFLRRW